VIALLGSLSQPLPADPTPIETPTVDWAAEAPLLVLVVGALVLMLISSFVRARRTTWPYTVLTCLIALGSIAAVVPLWREVQDPDRGPFSTLGGAVGVDGF
jgi:hypothetical protein